MVVGGQEILALEKPVPGLLFFEQLPLAQAHLVRFLAADLLPGPRRQARRIPAHRVRPFPGYADGQVGEIDGGEPVFPLEVAPGGGQQLAWRLAPGRLRRRFRDRLRFPGAGRGVQFRAQAVQLAAHRVVPAVDGQVALVGVHRCLLAPLPQILLGRLQQRPPVAGQLLQLREQGARAGVETEEGRGVQDGERDQQAELGADHPVKRPAAPGVRAQEQGVGHRQPPHRDGDGVVHQAHESGRPDVRPPEHREQVREREDGPDGEGGEGRQVEHEQGGQRSLSTRATHRPAPPAGARSAGTAGRPAAGPRPARAAPPPAGSSPGAAFRPAWPIRRRPPPAASRTRTGSRA